MRTARVVATAGLVVGLVACVQTGVLDFVEPSGAGRLRLDERNVPVAMRFSLGDGGWFELETFGSRQGGIVFNIKVPDNGIAQLAETSAQIACVDGTTRTGRIEAWYEYDVNRPMGEEALRFSASAPLKGRYVGKATQSLTGQYTSVLRLDDPCPAGRFRVMVAPVLVDGNPQVIGEVTFTPKRGRRTWIEPLQ